MSNVRFLKMKIKISEMVKTDVLTGKIPGKILYGQLVSMVHRKPEPEILFLDFSDIQLATSSYLRESSLNLKKYCLNLDLNLYTVLANATDATLVELEDLLDYEKETFYHCKIDSLGSINYANLLGLHNLEEKQKITFRAILDVKKADANFLYTTLNVDDISINGWNNRLANLASKGILMELRKNRSKFYQPVLEITNGQ